MITWSGFHGDATFNSSTGTSEVHYKHNITGTCTVELSGVYPTQTLPWGFTYWKQTWHVKNYTAAQESIRIQFYIQSMQMTWTLVELFEVETLK